MPTRILPDPNSKPCPICQSGSQKAFISKHDYVILKCQSKQCGHLFVGQEVPSILEPENPVFEEQFFDQIPEVYVQRNEQLIDYWQQHQFIKPTGTFLDFGCGVGHISKSLKHRYPQLQITCIEIKPAFLKHLEKCGFRVTNNLQEVVDPLDAILLLEVIEHIPDPIQLLAQLRSRLATGGKIFLTTPCGQLKTGTFKLEAHDDPTHHHFFTEKSLKLACQLAGFSPIQLELIPVLYPWSIQEQAAPRWRIPLIQLKRILHRWIARTRGYAHLTGFLHKI